LINGSLNGYVTIKYANDGEIFHGNYANGVKEGVGLIKWKDGAQY